MIRETSIEAFNEIKNNGLLSERRQRVYEIIFKLGAMSGAQVANEYYKRYGRTSASETIRNRITELRDMGVVKEVGKMLDVNTGMSVIKWEITNKLPTKLKKKTKCTHCKGTGFYEEK